MEGVKLKKIIVLVLGFLISVFMASSVFAMFCGDRHIAVSFCSEANNDPEACELACIRGNPGFQCEYNYETGVCTDSYNSCPDTDEPCLECEQDKGGECMLAYECLAADGENIGDWSCKAHPDDSDVCCLLGGSGDDVPEFNIVGLIAAIVVIGGIAVFWYIKKRKK